MWLLRRPIIARVDSLFYHFIHHPFILWPSAYTNKWKAEEEYIVIAPSKLYLFYFYLQQEGLIISSCKHFWLKNFFVNPERHFASANEAYPDFNFYVEPEAEVKKVAELLLERKFTLLFGHRQSGKSTTCHAILRLVMQFYDGSTLIWNKLEKLALIHRN